MESKDQQQQDDRSEEHPTSLIPELLRLFYGLGWVTGTGGGISIKKGETIFIAPSGVQKERVEGAHLFTYSLEGQLITAPQHKHLKLTPSACTPLFFNAYHKANAGACIHTHSMNAMLVTLLYKDEFRVTHLEMIKGIKGHGYTDTLVIPIIENTSHEEDLKESMAAAMDKYPTATAVLVRRHGVYVWGDTWEKAKTQAECYDYLFEAAIKMKQMGLDPTKFEEIK